MDPVVGADSPATAESAEEDNPMKKLALMDKEGCIRRYDHVLQVLKRLT